jgi:hypothetical protein
MRQDLMPQDDRVLGLQTPGPLDRQWPKAVERAANREVARGLQGAARAQAAGYVATARVEAAELVTERAMLGVHRLHQVCEALGASDPIEADELSGLVRDFTLVSRMELRTLARRW